MNAARFASDGSLPHSRSRRIRIIRVERTLPLASGERPLETQLMQKPLPSKIIKTSCLSTYMSGDQLSARLDFLLRPTMVWLGRQGESDIQGA